MTLNTRTYHMKLSEEGALERPASMSRRKQLRPFKVQDDDDDDGDKNHDNGTNGANQPNSTDVNGLETTPNGNNADVDDETLHNTPESGKFNVCVYVIYTCVCVRVRYQMPFTCFDEMRCFEMIFRISISFSTSNRFFYSSKMKMYILDFLFQEECLRFHCSIVFFFVFSPP